MNCPQIRFWVAAFAAVTFATPFAAVAAPAAPAKKAAKPAAKRPAPAATSRSEEELIDVLTVTTAKKNNACRELRTVGTEKSIPALSALLTDKDLSHPARLALEPMPYPAAGAALRKAVGKTSGRVKAGLIDSLGERRESESVAVIAPALADSDKDVVAAAAWALGKIGTTDAAKALQTAREKATGDRRATIGQGLVLCARNLARVSEKDANAIFEQLCTPSEAKIVRSGAFAGLIRTAGHHKTRLVRGYLVDNDALVRAAGAGALPDLTTGELAGVAADFKELPVSSQISILSAVRIRGDRTLLDVALEGVTSPSDDVRLAAIRAVGAVGDSSALPKLLALAAKGGAAADAARQGIVSLSGKGVDATIFSMLRAEKDAKRRAEFIGIVATRHSTGAVALLLEEAKYPDAEVRARAMEALTPLAAPKDLTGLIEGVLAAEPGTEREAAERTVVRVLQPVSKPAERAELVVAAINASSGDHVALLPLAGRFGGKEVTAMVQSDLADSDARVKQLALRALCNWPDASVADELLRRAETCTDLPERTMLLRAYIRVVSLPKQGSDAVRLERLKRAMSLAQNDNERAYILERAGAVRSLDSLRFVLPFVDQPALSEPACKAVAELAHHRELRDPHKPEFQAALEKVQQKSKDRLILERVKRYLDSMHNA
jgi:HEAT repeat protein